MSTDTLHAHEIVNQDDMKRFVYQIVKAAGDRGISDADLDAATDEFIEMFLIAGAVAMWQAGRLEFEWRDGEMVWRLPEAR